MSQCQRHNPARNNRGLLVDQEDLYDEEEVLDCGKAVNFTYYDHLGKGPRNTLANLKCLKLNFGYHICLFNSNSSSFIRDSVCPYVYSSLSSNGSTFSSVLYPISG
jgi:hypothetical protein